MKPSRPRPPPWRRRRTWWWSRSIRRWREPPRLPASSVGIDLLVQQACVLLLSDHRDCVLLQPMQRDDAATQPQSGPPGVPEHRRQQAGGRGGRGHRDRFTGDTEFAVYGWTMSGPHWEPVPEDPGMPAVPPDQDTVPVPAMSLSALSLPAAWTEPQVSCQGPARQRIVTGWRTRIIGRAGGSTAGHGGHRGRGDPPGWVAPQREPAARSGPLVATRNLPRELT